MNRDTKRGVSTPPWPHPRYSSVWYHLREILATQAHHPHRPHLTIHRPTPDDFSPHGTPLFLSSSPFLADTMNRDTKWGVSIPPHHIGQDPSTRVLMVTFTMNRAKTWGVSTPPLHICCQSLPVTSRPPTARCKHPKSRRQSTR
jgi:hypothetical protein